MPVHPVERKLAAIFAADIAGYSRLMARDEIGTLARLKACRVIIDELIALHRGRIFNTAGDSVVADFASAVDAVQCAVAVLPFQNMCGDPEQEYFADGMVEEIITALSRIHWLFVIARNSTFTLSLIHI